MMKNGTVLGAMVLFAFLAGRFYLVAGDDGTYIALARSLSSGSYRALNTFEEIPQTQYPPLFPALLLPVANQPPGNVGVQRLWVSLWSLLAVFAVGRAARLRDPGLGAIAALPFILSPLFGEYGTSIMPEVLFIAACYWAVARTDELLAREDSRAVDPLLAAMLPLAMLLKSSAAALVPAVLLSLLIRRRFRMAVISLVVFLAAMAPWWIWQNLKGSHYLESHILMRDIYDLKSDYLSLPELFTYRIPRNASRYAGRIMADVLLPPFFRNIAPWSTLFPLKVAISTVLSLTVLAGFLRHLRARALSTEHLFVLAATGMLFVHPVFADRYLFLLLPSFIGYLLFLFRDPARRRRATVTWAGALLLGCVLAVEAPLPREELAYVQAVEYVNEHAATNDRVLGRKPTMVWYYTGRKAQAYTVSTDVSLWPRANWVIRDSYVIGPPVARLFADPVLADTSRFRMAYSAPLLPEVKVYEVVGEDVKWRP